MTHHLSQYGMAPMLFALSFMTTMLLSPDTSHCLWQAVTRLIEERRAMRLAKKSAELDAKLKKYWVVDMRDLHH